MKKYVKTFGEIPEEVTILATKVFFDQDGIALVNDEVAGVLDEVPGYEFVSDEDTPSGEVKAPVEPLNELKEHEGVDDPENVGEGTPTEEPDEDEITSEDEEVVDEAKPTRAPAKRRPTPNKK